MFPFLNRSGRSARRMALRLETLEIRDVPALLATADLIAGADADSPPLVRIIDPTTQVIRTQFLAFDAAFYGGVRVATGDVTGDGNPDLVVAAGPGGGPAVQVYDGQTGAVVASFFAFDPTFAGGVHVATGDVDGDGQAEIIAGAGSLGGPAVSVFDASGLRLASFFAYASDFRGGVRVAAGDIDGDGTAEIITAPGQGGGPHVRTFHLAGGSAQPVGSFLAFDPGFTGGVYVAAGDVNGDGLAEVIASPGSGGGPLVGVFTVGGQPLSSFFAYDSSFRGGVRVAAADLSGDGIAEIITGAGPGGGPQMNVFSLPSTVPVAAAYGLDSAQRVGISVAGAVGAINIPATPASVIADAYAQLDAAKKAAEEVRQAALRAQQEAALRAAYYQNHGGYGYYPYYYPGYYYSPYSYGYYDPYYYDYGYYDYGYDCGCGGGYDGDF